MWAALALLQPRRRTALVLRYYEDLPIGEIARLLECRPGTVSSLLHRGLADLRKAFDDVA
jgi:RNA polymerase sigma factor (sigma-70 family)